MTGRLFIFGLGYSGLEIARLARAAGWQVAGTVRDPDKARQYRAEGIETHLFDGTAPLAVDPLIEATHVLSTIAPGPSGDPALPALRLCGPRLHEARWFGYLSTTGVYGDAGGGWVDENTPPRPGQPRSIQRLAAEREWHGWTLDAGVTIFRLPGIYGPGRSAIDQVKAGTARRIDKPGQAFSRIHVADIANTVLTVLTRPEHWGLFNVADDLPAPTADVIAYACELLGVPMPPLVSWEQVGPTMSAMARSFYAENRKVKNDRIKQELGVTLRYPTFREGLHAIARTTSP